MYYGVQYYPEHWPESRWPVDAEMMRKAGVNGVRMGEFAWSAYEPAEGRLDFSWMERALDILHRNGIRAIFCTCSRTPPPWLYRKHPDIVNISGDGRVNPQANRYRIGLIHPRFIEHGERIDQAVIQHFAGHPAIQGWQIDNEIGAANDCYCPVCVGAFRNYLKDKYGTPAQLNEAWGAHFWSFAFQDFDEVPAPGGGQLQLELEYRRFMSHRNVEFARKRLQWIHQYDPGKPVTTNCQALWTPHTDWHAMNDVMDVPAMNHYPPRTPRLTLDLYRGAGDQLMVLEQFTRLQHHDAGDGWMRLWAWMTLAHGATAVNFFRWRQCRWGQEQFADGILPHSGKENRLYRELTRMGAEIQKVGRLIDGTRVPAEVAILLGYDSRWAVGVSRYAADLDPAREATDFHEALLRRNVAAHVLDPHKPLDAYRLVIAPRLWMTDAAVADSLRAFVARGGILLLTAGSGVVDEFGKSFDTPRPGLLTDLLGIEVSDLAILGAAQTKLSSSQIPGKDGATAGGWADEIHPAGADIVAAYAGGWRSGHAVLTRHRAGAGCAYYLGSRLHEPALAALVDHLLRDAGVEGLMPTPEGVSARLRKANDRRLLFLLNYTESCQTVRLGDAWQDAFTQAPVTAAEIPPVDLRLLVQTC